MKFYLNIHEENQQKSEIMVQILDVLICNTIYDQLMRVVKEAPKIEIVGLCFGLQNESKIRVKHLVIMTNLDNSPVSFSLDYELLFKEIQIHEQKGESLVGIFHSHPRGAKIYPSDRDIHFMGYWPHPYIWLIGGGDQSNPKLKIFSLLKEEIIEIRYSIVNT
jgi:proteasome lid subunit RPN8/RPN11